MVVEAAPPAPFIIAKPEFLLQLLIIALDPPSQLCDINQTFEGDILWQSGKPILGRLGFFWRPLDQQPLFGARLGSARYRDVPAAPSAAQSAKRASLQRPRAT